MICPLPSSFNPGAAHRRSTKSALVFTGADLLCADSVPMLMSLGVWPPAKEVGAPRGGQSAAGPPERVDRYPCRVAYSR